MTNITIDKSSSIPAYQQIGDQIGAMISDGRIAADTKLPPIRALASELGVSNITIVGAYRYLEQKKLAYARIGSGTYATELLHKIRPIPADINRHAGEQEFELKDAINFANSSTPAELFPIAEFKKLFNQVLDRDKGNAFSYTDIQGYEPLREAVCGYLEGYGIKSDAEKVQIISGAQQGVDIISKALLMAGDVVFVENPTYYGAVGAFLSRGAQVIPVNMQKDGIDLDRLRGLLKLYRPKFIYVMTYFQTPTCVSYSMAKKRTLLELAAQYDTYIIEEDNQSEFNYGTGRVTPLKSLDHRNRVIYIKSFSKILMPGLRIGFMVLPKKVGQQAAAAKHTSDIYTSGFTQRAFELYLRSEHWQRHTEMMRRTFMERYEFFIKQADAYLRPYVKYTKPGGGLSLWLELRNKELSARDICGRLLEERVVATPGAVFSTDEYDLPFLRLSFADLECEKIRQGIKTIAKVFKEQS